MSFLPVNISMVSFSPAALLLADIGFPVVFSLISGELILRAGTFKACECAALGGQHASLQENRVTFRKVYTFDALDPRSA